MTKLTTLAKILFISLSMVILFVIGTNSNVFAQTAGSCGEVICCTQVETFYFPPGCTRDICPPLDPYCVECTSSGTECVETNTLPCGIDAYGSCNVDSSSCAEFSGFIICGGTTSLCGNGVCNSGENCSNCAADCNTWSSWSSCSVSCGGGTQTRTATCTGATQTQACNTQACTGGETCGWTGWSGCSASCGGGTQSRTYTCTGYVETQACNTQACVSGCLESCTQPFCGQVICAGTINQTTCSSSDAGPTGPVTLTPANGSSVTTDASGRVTVSWTPATKAESYELQLYPAGTSCGHSSAYCGVVYATSYTFTPDSNYTSYSFQVRGINTSCGANAYGPYSGISTFNIVGLISGGFYLDPNAECTTTGATTVNPGSAAAIGAETRTGSTNGTINDTSFSILAPFWPATSTPNNIITLIPGEAAPGDAYECTCPVGCTYSGIASPQSGVDFFLRPASLSNNSWWQVFGGSSYAAAQSGSALVSKVPPPCNDGVGCSPFIMREDLVNTPDSAGFAVTGGGEVDSAEAAGYQTSAVTDRTSQVVAKGTRSDKFKETYNYFYRQYSLGTDPATTDDFSATADDASKPTTPPNGGKTAYFHQGNLTIQNPWHLQVGDPVTEIVIFVNGDLNITDINNVGQLIQVDPGTFLAFIVSGDIIIDENVGNDTLSDNTPNIEGVYIADQDLRIESKGLAGGGDESFVGAGTFAGWGGVELLRDYASDSDPSRIQENNTKAVERFIFRPDFVSNIPERMATPRYVWQESN